MERNTNLIMDWLCMKKSGINNARLRLFAKVSFKKGVFIGLHTGGSDGPEPHGMKLGWADGEVITCHHFWCANCFGEKLAKTMEMR